MLKNEFVEGWNSTEIAQKEAVTYVTVWFTREQLEDIMKSKEHAKIVIEEELNTPDSQRPHERPSLAKRGIMEYKHTMTTEQLEQWKLESAGTKSKADLNPAEYARVTSDLRGAGAPPGQVSRVAAAKFIL